MAARAAPEQVAGKPESDLIVALAPVLDDFIAELFGIAHEVQTLRVASRRAGAALLGQATVRAAPRRQEISAPIRRRRFDGPALRRELEALIGGELTELRFAERVEPG